MGILAEGWERAARITNRYLNHHAEGCEVNVNLGRELIFGHQALEVDGYFTEHEDSSSGFWLCYLCHPAGW